jgi:hypothetical protein
MWNSASQLWYPYSNFVMTVFPSSSSYSSSYPTHPVPKKSLSADARTAQEFCTKIYHSRQIMFYLIS